MPQPSSRLLPGAHTTFLTPWREEMGPARPHLPGAGAQLLEAREGVDGASAFALLRRRRSCSRSRSCSAQACSSSTWVCRALDGFCQPGVEWGTHGWEGCSGDRASPLTAALVGLGGWIGSLEPHCLGLRSGLRNSLGSQGHTLRSTSQAELTLLCVSSLHFFLLMYHYLLKFTYLLPIF